MKSKVDGMNKEALFLLGVFKGLNWKLALRAVYYMVEKHGDRMRDDQVTMYFEHPIRVARMLYHSGILDEVIITAALLHDLVEDGHVTLEEIRGIFGAEVALLVDLLTKTKDMSADEYYARVASDIRAVLIKAFDRVCNVDDMIDVFAKERLKKYIAETEERVLPMMKHARRVYLDYTDVLINARDYIKGILQAAKKVVELYEKVETLSAT